MTQDQSASRSDEALLPCPFCGGKASFGTGASEGVGGHFIECGKCNASTALVFPLKDDVTRELLDRWNARSIRSERGTPINQCDGCQRGLPVVNGKHDLTGTAGSYPGEVMACTKDRYVDHKVIEAIRVGCNAAEVHLTCSYPACSCKQIPAAIRAALSERPD